MEIERTQKRHSALTGATIELSSSDDEIDQPTTAQHNQKNIDIQSSDEEGLRKAPSDNNNAAKMSPSVVDESPSKEQQGKKKGSSSDSDSDSPAPVVKKKRATRKFRQTSTKPPDEAITSTAAIYSTKVDNIFSDFHYGSAGTGVREAVSGPVLHISEDEDTEKAEVFTVSKKQEKEHTTPRRQRKKVQHFSPSYANDSLEYLCDSSQNTPEKTIPVRPTCSPSPPPPPGPPTYHRNVKQKRPTKALKTALANLNRAKTVLGSASSISADDSYTYCPTPEKQHDIVVKVRTRSGVHRFPMKPHDIFATLISKLAEIENCPDSHCILFLNDTTIEPYQTLTSSGVTVADILQCCIQDEKPVLEEQLDVEDDEDCIDVRVQCSNKRMAMTVTMKKNEALHKVMHRFATEREVDLKTIRFEFDGETLTGSETPNDLDMEDDDCLDAIFS